MQKTEKTESNTQAPLLSITNFRRTLDLYINSTPYLRPSREVSLAHTYLQRAFMWLGEAQGATGSESPHKDSFNHKTPAIEPTADHTSSSLMNALWDMEEYGTHTARVKSLRSLIAEHVKNFHSWRKASESAGPDYDEFLKQSWLSVMEASMWLGWELANIKKQQESAGVPMGSSPHPAGNLPL